LLFEVVYLLIEDGEHRLFSGVYHILRELFRVFFSDSLRLSRRPRSSTDVRFLRLSDLLFGVFQLSYVDV
jgi:hypothetical protein